MGSGFRTFTAGEVLTASNVQNYLMDQSVMVFASSSARASAIGTANFEEGMVTYLTDVDQVQAYNGSSWAQVGQTPGLVLLNTTTFSAVASQAFTSVLSSSYKFFKITFSIGGSTALTTTFRLRASTTDYTGGNYRAGGHVITDGASQSLYGSTTGTSWEMSANAGDANSSFGEITLIRPNEAGVRTGYVQTGFELTGSAQRLRYVSGYLDQTSAYDGFNLIASTGTITGVVNVYGYNQ